MGHLIDFCFPTLGNLIDILLPWVRIFEDFELSAILHPENAHMLKPGTSSMSACDVSLFTLDCTSAVLEVNFQVINLHFLYIRSSNAC